jgi:hypothetical protein
MDPFWLQRARGWSNTVVGEDGLVLHKGEPMRFADESLPPGTPVQVRLGSQWYAVTQADIEAEQREREEREAAERQRERERRNAMRARSEALIASIHLPVRWESAIKDVLSGLSATSWGDGRNSATVEHIRLLEDLHDGRLHRQAGDFLCTSASGTNGQQWNAQVAETFLDGEGKPYMPAPSCKACLRLAQRYVSTPSQEPQKA